MVDILIDGSIGEGGGQILRTALPLSLITNKVVEIFNIRKNRPKPGLKHQHLACLKIIERITNSKIEGAFLSSERVKIIPGKIKNYSIEYDLKTAGSINLVLQAILPLAKILEKPLKVKLKGGTDVPFSPSSDYVSYVLLPCLKIFGVNVDYYVIKRGFYPKGGGIVEITIYPWKDIKKIELIDTPNYTVPRISIVASEELKSRKVCERIYETVSSKIDIEGNIKYVKTSSIGVVTCIYNIGNNFFIGADQLGEKKLPSEKVAELLIKKYLFEINSKANVDKHLADMIIPFMFISSGSIKTSEFTNHCKTNIEICKKFFDEKIVKINNEKKIISISN